MPPELQAALEQPDQDEILVWPDMADAVALFFAMSTQWRWVGAGMGGLVRTGLDYAVLPAIAGAHSIDTTPEVLNDLKTLELAAVEEWGRRR